MFARHSLELQHNLHYDVFIKISLRFAGFNPSMATSQLHPQVPTVSVTPDFADNYNDYISYTVITAVKILSQSLSKLYSAGSEQHTREGLWLKILVAYSADVGFNNICRTGVMQHILD